MAKYNWDKLRQKLSEGSYKNLKEFCDKNKVIYNGTARKELGGILTEKRHNKDKIKTVLAQKKDDFIESELKKQESKIKEIVKEELNRTARQLYLAQLLGDKIENALKARFKTEFDKEGNALQIVFDTKDLKAIASSLIDLQKVERTAEGLDNKTQEDEEGSGLKDLNKVIDKSRELYK